MKQTYKFTMAILAMITLTQMGLAIGNCPELLELLTHPDYSWRNSISHPLSSGKVLASNAKRENDIKLSRDLMKAELEGKLTSGSSSDTPPMIVIPGGEASVISFSRPWEEYGDMIADVTGAKDGVLRATVLLPVSGHTGMENAALWAKSDTYKLYYRDSTGKDIPLVTGAPSLDFITAQEVEIPLEDGKPVTLFYHRSGSLGPGGYQGGRILQLTWRKGAPVAAAPDYSKSFWSNASHP